MSTPRARIGLLEESADNRELIVELLVTEGFEVVAFDDVDGLLAYRDEMPLFAVADAWTARQRERELCAILPIGGLLVMTTADSLEGVWRALGAARILTKPFFTHDLVRKVRELAAPEP